MPVHQPPDRKDDKDQPEYAADSDRSALTVIAAPVEPKPTSKENHEQQDKVPSGVWLELKVA